MTVVGFVGLGLIGSRRLAIARDLGCEVAFAVDPDSAKRDTLRATIPSDCTYVSTIGDIAETDLKAIDAVFVAVPHDQALAACSWAFEHGAHVLCEKPMGVSLAQAVEIEKRAASANRIFCAGFNYRYLPTISGLSELLRGGQLGDIYRVRMMIGHGGRPGMEKEWKLVKARSGGGALIDPGIHLVDLARSLFGEPLVQAASLHRKFWDSDVEDNCVIALTCQDTEVSIDVTLTSWKNIFAIEVYGEQGTALLSGRGGNYGPQRLEYVNRWFWQEDDRRTFQDYGESDPSFALETTSFIEAVRSGWHDDRLSDAADGVAALRIVEDLYRTAGSLPEG
jgi:predicted dehydrogenase